MSLTWEVVHRPPPVLAGGLQIWRLATESSASLVRRLAQCLSAEERERGARTRDGRPRIEFLAGRGLLRHLLASQLQIAPESVIFAQNDHGKLRLGSSQSSSHVAFNLSHAGGVVLVALSRSGEVGVDIERVDLNIETLEIAALAFTASEQEQLKAASSPAQQCLLFFHLWTRKEAICKADGRGLTAVTADPLLKSAANAYKTASFDAGPGMLGAVATADSPAFREYFDASKLIVAGCAADNG